MSKTLKVLALMLAVLLTLGIFAGCGKKKDVIGSSSVLTESEVDPDTESGNPDGDDKNDNSSKTKSDKTSSTKSRRTKSSNKQDADFNATGWPIVNKKITLSIMHVSTLTADVAKMAFFKEYEKKSNIAIKCISVAEGKIGERKALALQSGDLPSMFCFYNNSFSDFELSKYTSEGTFVNIKDDLKKYAPNIYKSFDDPVQVALNQMSDGSVYIIPDKPLRSDAESYDHWLNINKKWLDALGLPIPKTTQEFLTTMRAFRDGDPNGNGQADEIPFAMWNWGEAFIVSGWGIRDIGSGIGVDNTGKAYYNHATPNFKAACQYWHDFLAEKGLMQGDIVGKQDGFWSAFVNHIKSGKVGCFHWSYLSEPSFPADLLEQFVAIPYPTANFSNAALKLPASTQPYNSTPTRGSKIITKKCPNVPALLRWYDYLYTDEGIMFGNYGPESTGYYKKLSDGSYKLSDNAVAGVQAPTWNLGIPAITSLSKKPDAGNVGGKVYRNYSAAANATYKRANAENKSYRLPEVIKTASEISQMRKFESLVATSGLASSYVTGWKDINTHTTYLNELSAKGLDKYVALWQQIVDRNKAYLFTV